MKMNDDPEWLKEKATLEDGSAVSVGGSLYIDPQLSYCRKCGVEEHPHQTCEQANMSDEEIRCALLAEEHAKLWPVSANGFG